MVAEFELFDHTADIGVRVRAGSLAELLEAATRGLYTVIGELCPGREAIPTTIEIEGECAADLMRDFLAEMLFCFEHEQLMATSLEVEVFNESLLRVHVQMRDVVADTSAMCREVKAITYHDLAVNQTGEGYEATYIVDI